MPDAPELESGPNWLDRLPALAVGAAFVAVALAVYWIPGYDRFYNHFVLQAAAFLRGEAAIPTPQFQDVLPILGSDGQPTGFGLLPFPPLPAVVLMPFVAVWGLDTNERVVSVVLGALAVGLAWWALGFLRVSRPIRFATTAFFGTTTMPSRMK